jgi:hypothetical protein
VHDEERADYRLTESDDSYVLEVKDKFDSDSVIAEYHSTLASGNVFLRRELTGYKNSVSNVLEKAESQLSNTAESASEFRIAWLELGGIDRELQFQQAMGTIYGTVQLLPFGPTVATKDCYFFKYNVAHRNTDIDAIIVSDGGSCLLAANPFSPRFLRLKFTKLWRFFAEKEAVVDPITLEANGAIYTADCAIPRRDTQAVLEYLQAKYNVERFLDLEPTSTSAYVEVRPNDKAK